MFVILLIELPVQLNLISKKLSRETMILLEFSERIPATLSLLAIPWTHVKQGWYYKVWQPIMTPPQLLEANV